MTIECTEFRIHQSGALQGFANFRIEKMGIEIFGCGVFMKDGRRWLSLPSREYEDPQSGEKKYAPIMKFIENKHQEFFCKTALQVMDEWCEKQQQEPESDPDEEELPF